jgi:hypothetical protein
MLRYTARLCYTSLFKKIELTLQKMAIEMVGLFEVVKGAIFGKLPIKLLSTPTLQHILGNVTLKLPEGYELTAGTRSENIHQYYELTQVSVAANSHSICLILSIPLTPAERQFI